jgi:hypothetical protein
MARVKRKRIKNTKVVAPIVDDKIYSSNGASSNAKKIIIFNENLKIEIWIDKHYQNRVYHGSDDGTVRDGIEYTNIEPVLIKSFKHLLYYSLKFKPFVFINHPPNKIHNIRIVLKELKNGEFINIVVEYHFIDLNTIEVTIVTALTGNNFNMSNGQFGIEFDNHYSKLIQYNKRILNELDNYEYED